MHSNTALDSCLENRVYDRTRIFLLSFITFKRNELQKRLKYKVKSLEKRSTPTYSPNAWTDLAHFSAREPSCEYFQTHRGDFRILSWKSRYGHIWRFLRGRIGVPKMSIFGSYLGSEDEIKKSPRCVRKYSQEGSLTKK